MRPRRRSANSARRLRSSSPSSRRAACVAAPFRIAAGSGPVHAVADEDRRVGRALGREQRPDHRDEHVDRQGRHVAAGDDDDRLLGRLEAGEQPDERAAVRLRIDGATDGHVAVIRQRPLVARRDDDDHLGADRRRRRRPHDSRRVRPSSTAVELVRAEPARRAAGEDDAADAFRPPARRRRPRSRPGFERGARPGHVAVRRPAQDARRSRSSRIAITYLRLVPVASRKAAGVSGAAAASASACALERRGTSDAA